MLANYEFVYSKINLMLGKNSKEKVKILSVYKKIIFFFIYNIKTIDPSKFSYPGVHDVNAFWPKTKIIVELKIHFCNFKTRRQKRNLRYFFKLIGFYKLQDVKIFPLSTLQKRQKETNKFIATPFKTKNTCSTLNLLKWIIDWDIERDIK